MRRGTRRFLPVVAGFFVVAVALPLGPPSPAAAVSPNIVISQLYGGGGNSGATLTHDFVELFNRGATSVNLTGWNLQYASATGSFGTATNLNTPLSGSVPAGGYLLIQEAQGAGGTTALPPPDVTDSTPIAMSATAGKVRIVDASSTVVDLVGYGATASEFEGAAPAPQLSNTTAAFRAANGCTDTDSNGADFAAASPVPRNSSAPLNPCGGPPALSIGDVSASEGNSGATSFAFTVSLSEAAGSGGVTFDIATADGTATTANNDYAANSLTGQTIAAGNTTYQFSVSVTGDAIDEPDETFAVNVTNVTGATVADGQALGTIVNDDGCGQGFTPIYQIQGSGAAAAITGNVTTEGVVVGDFEGPQASGLQGIHIQDVTGDGNAATSDGIFVFTGDTDNSLSAGDVVRVTGFARERFNQTVLNGSNSNSSPVTNIIDCGTTASVTPVTVNMPFADATFLERHEGMLVRFPQQLVISEYFNYDRFGELVLALPLAGETRPFTPTLIDEPGAAAQARLLANQLRRITLDDGIADPNNTPVLRHPNGSPFSLTNRFRGGDHVANTVGVIGFDFNLYRIQPTAPADYTASNARSSAPEDVGGRLKVAAMNTLNFFLTLDTTSSDSGPGPCGGNANLDCRGADASQPLEFDRQRDKLIAALAGLDADVIGLNELENTPGVDPLGDPTRGLVAGLNGVFGPGAYDHIDTGVIGTDAIRVGLVYRTDAVRPVGNFELLTSADDPRFDETRSRPALAQTFEEIATGARFTVVVNHLKSKSESGLAPSSGPRGVCNDSNPANDVPDCDQGDGQGFWNPTRRAAAEALVDWLATDPTGSGDPDFLIIGDLNAYAQEDPIDEVRAGADDTLGTGDDYTNLIREYQGAHAYSFVFDGMAGYLDHALSNQSLTTQVTGATEWHINADEPDLLDYDTSFKPPAQEELYESNAYRSSDHDPVIVGLNLTPDRGKVTGSGTFAGGSFDVSAQFENATWALTGSTTLGLTGIGTFASTSYDWLSVAGNRATWQGVGTLDGNSGYGFFVSVKDGGGPGTSDRIRVKVWDDDGVVVFDSQPGSVISAAPTSALTTGNVTVHKPK